MINYTTDPNLTLLDGVNIRTLGCFIESAQGFLDYPEKKEAFRYSWPDEHGADIDTAHMFYVNELKCSLTLIFSGDTLADLFDNIKSMRDLWRSAGVRHLKMYGIPGVFTVYTTGLISVTRQNRGVSTKQVARMVIPLSDPYPNKLMYYVDQREGAGTVTLAITTSEQIFIAWGDGTVSPYYQETDIDHVYALPGEYCICLYGPLRGVTALVATGATMIDSLLWTAT